jgi:hypothetical protein
MTQQQIDRLVRGANPVPDVAALEPLEVSFPKLDEQRRLDMPGNDRVEMDKEADEPRRGLLIGAGVAALIVVVGLFAIQPWDGQAPVAQPATTVTQITDVTPSSTASPTASPTDTSTWTTFESDRYGFTIGHPSDWEVVPADHDWTLTGDAARADSTGQEVFRAPDHDIRVSAWSVALDPDTVQTWADVEAWVEQYCQQTDQPFCTGIHGRAVELCLEFRDCHPGLLVPFANDVQAFFTGGDYGDQMVVVVVWRPDSDPSVAQYGGARRLLEAFLSTMWVCPRPGITLESCPNPETPPSG